VPLRLHAGKHRRRTGGNTRTGHLGTAHRAGFGCSTVPAPDRGSLPPSNLDPPLRSRLRPRHHQVVHAAHRLA
jgi:hypothetical protein